MFRIAAVAPASTETWLDLYGLWVSLVLVLIGVLLLVVDGVRNPPPPFALDTTMPKRL